MSISAELSVDIRHSSTKGQLRELRKSGIVPGVVYGHHVEAVPVQVGVKELVELLGKVSSSSIITLQLKGANERMNAMVKDIQFDAIRRTPLHIDWQAVSMDEPVSVAIPIHLVGKAPGEASGGVVQLGAREVAVRAKPNDLPDRLDVDISSLNVGDHIAVSALVLPTGVELQSNPDELIVGVVAPNLEEEEVPPTEIVTDADAEAEAKPEAEEKPE